MALKRISEKSPDNTKENLRLAVKIGMVGQ